MLEESHLKCANSTHRPTDGFGVKGGVRLGLAGERLEIAQVKHAQTAVLGGLGGDVTYRYGRHSEAW